MHFLITLLFVAVVHLARAVTAWTQVGLLADDRHFVGAAVLRHRGDWSFGSMWVPEGPAVADAATALYRPFIDLSFWLEQPWFGVDATGYHVVNSVLHCGTAMLWFVLMRRLSSSVAAGMACALLFVGWPSHGEATHWIAARTNVQATFLLSVALLLLDVGLCRTRRAARAALCVAAAAVATAAVGTKESAVFVLPLAACLAWLRAARTTYVARAFAAVPPVLPMAIALGAWLAWRAHVIGTWGSGTHYGWHASRMGWQACTDWLELLLAPRHHAYTAPLWSPVQWVLHGALLVAAAVALRHAAARRVVAVGAPLLLLGYVAGIGLESMAPATLENARYSYEPVLGLCAVLAVGIAALPGRVRGIVLAALVLVHAQVFDGNRRSWLGAGALYRRMEHDIVAIARATRQPIRVLQAPGVYEGAFALLNGFTEFQFMQAFAPAGTDLRGKVSSTQEWRDVLHELAAAAAAQQAPANAYVVQWNDGALARFEVDPQWPVSPSPGLRIDYAWVARCRPFAGSSLPVHVLVTAREPFELQVHGEVAGRRFSGPTFVGGAAAGAQAILLSLPLPADLEVDVPVTVALQVHAAGEAASHAGLGVTVPAARAAH
jgi:hypothetical protein